MKDGGKNNKFNNFRITNVDRLQSAAVVRISCHAHDENYGVFILKTS